MKPFWKMPCFYLAIVGSVITGLQMYPSLLPPGKFLDLSHVMMGVIVLVAAWSRGLRPDAPPLPGKIQLPDNDKTPLGGGTALLWAMGVGLAWAVLSSAGCATFDKAAGDLRQAWHDAQPKYQACDAEVSSLQPIVASVGEMLHVEPWVDTLLALIKMPACALYALIAQHFQHATGTEAQVLRMALSISPPPAAALSPPP